MRHSQMLEREIQQIDLAALYTPLLPLTSFGWGMARDAVDIAFDAEYQNDIEMLISYQFTGRKRQDGTVFTKISYVNAKGGITPEEFLNLVTGFLHDLGYAETPPEVYLISFAAAAELRYIKDYINRFKLRETHKGLGWDGEFGEEIRVRGEIDFKGTHLRVIDLAGFYPGFHLVKIGDAVGYPKVDIDTLVPGKPPKYWITHMTELLAEHPAAFEIYSKTDSEIVQIAWESLLKTWRPKGLDPHFYRTIPSLTMADFKKNWLKESPIRLRVFKERRPFIGRDQKWSEGTRTTYIFDDDHEARMMAMEAYWGGYNLAFCRGHKVFKPGEAYFYDFISLYVAAAIMQPLPNAQTVWLHGSGGWAVAIDPDGEITKKRWDELEGFIRFEFEWPPDTERPFIPVMLDRFRKLTFPLKGITTCTIAEARAAMEYGCIIRPLRVVGFFPGPTERSHVFARFLLDTLDKKNHAKSGSLEYYDFKLRMVSVIGKFEERSEQYDFSHIQEIMWQSKMSLEQVQKAWRKPITREAFRKARTVGRAWWPEAASLILGKARSITGQVVYYGCYHISTDGGVFPKEAIDAAKTLPDVQEMSKIGSGFRAELPKEITEPYQDYDGQVDEILVVRTRMYGSWYKGIPVHNARHSVHVRPEDWDKMLRDGIAAGQHTVETYETFHLGKVKELIEGRIERVFDEVHKTMKLSWKWDNKRFLNVPLGSFEDPFTGFCMTSPPLTIEDCLAIEKPPKPSGRKKSQQVSDIARKRKITRGGARTRLSRAKDTKLTDSQ